MTEQTDHEAFFCIRDLGLLARSPSLEPTQLGEHINECLAVLLASGLDPGRCSLFLESQVPSHTRLCRLLQYVTDVDELRILDRWSDNMKSGRADAAPVASFTDVLLQSAEIVLYDAERVPVGQPGREIVELCRNIAWRFNRQYGETFVLPEPHVPPTGARIMDLHEPLRPMSGTTGLQRGTILVVDEPEVIQRKFVRATLDPTHHVRYDPTHRPATTNLLEILAACTRGDPATLAEEFDDPAMLRTAAAAAVIDLLAPVRERYLDIVTSPDAGIQLLEDGCERANAIASQTLGRVERALGLVPPLT